MLSVYESVALPDACEADVQAALDELTLAVLALHASGAAYAVGDHVEAGLPHQEGGAPFGSRRPAVGFALQVEDAEVHAERKLREKDLDAIVLDKPEAMGDVVADYRILRADGTWTACPGLDKTALSERLVELLESLSPTQPRP